MKAPIVRDDGLADAREQVARTRALLEGHVRSDADVLRFYRCERTILLGQGVCAEDELDLAACAARGVTVAHRASGGGALFLHDGVLAFDLIGKRRPFASAAAGFRDALGTALVAAIASFGVSAEKGEDGDVLIGANKVAGLAGAIEGRTLLAQGFVLLRNDRRAMAGLLRREARTRREGVAMIGLDAMLGKRVQREWMVEAIASALRETRYAKRAA